MLDPRANVGRLGLRDSIPLRPARGGSSILGEGAALGEIENVDPESDIRDGAPSIESALEPSEVHGEGSEGSI